MITLEEFKKKHSDKCRLIGLDLGSKRIGVSICDEKQLIATPLKTINRNTLTELISELKAIIDENNIKALKTKFIGPAVFNFINEDILNYEIEGMDLRVVGNLPYNISTQIILKLLNNVNQIIDMHFLVQKEVALKITGNVSTKNWGKLAIKIAAFYDSEILFDVPPEAFDIKPKVTSSFIRLIPKKNLNFSNTSKKNLFALIDLAFASKRKNIKNNLKKLNINWAKVDIDPTKRPEELTLESFIKLSEEMKNL